MSSISVYVSLCEFNVILRIELYQGKHWWADEYVIWVVIKNEYDQELPQS